MPTYWMELDKTCNDGASEIVLYDSVSVLVSTEKLSTKRMLINLSLILFHLKVTSYVAKKNTFKYIITQLLLQFVWQESAMQLLISVII